MVKLQSRTLPAVAILVVACGARFSAHEKDGTAGGSTGETSGGFTSSAGATSAGDAGELEGGRGGSGGSSASAAGGSSTVEGGAGGSAGGAAAGRGGGGAGGRGTGSGGTTAVDCATLREGYQAAVAKARVCEEGAPDQCSPTSVALPVGGCGCPVLINAKSQAGTAAKKAYQTYLSAGCEHLGPICDIYCGTFATAICAQSATSGAFVCVGQGLEK